MALDSAVELLSPALDLDLLALYDERNDQRCNVIAAKVGVGVLELLRHQPPKLLQEIESPQIPGRLLS